jgi:hypothetical protein
MMHPRATMLHSRPVKSACVALLMLSCVGCASQAEKDAYNDFLVSIAEGCKPLIIGSNNIGQALQFNGVGGASPDDYNAFLGTTKALYYGNIPPTVYRTSLTATLGAGTYNDRSFDCIFAHLPKK